MHSDQRSHVRHNFRRHAPGSLLSPWEQAHQYPKIQLSVQVEPQHPDRFLRCRTIQTFAGLQRKACSAILTADSTQLFFSTASSHQEQGTEEQTGQVVEVSAGNGQHSCAQPPSGPVHHKFINVISNKNPKISQKNHGTREDCTGRDEHNKDT